MAEMEKMGCESKIYIVHKLNIRSDEDKRYAETVAMVDMRKCYPLSNVLRNKPETDCFVYADDGNTRIEEDRYGKPLTEITLNEAIQLVQNVINSDPDEYWRYGVLLATLQATYQAVGDHPDFAVLHFGY